MGKIYSTEASKSVAYKKAYNVEGGKTVKYKKAYIVENGKTVKLWSSFTPRFIGANHNQLFKSVNGVTWEAVDVPWDKSYKTYWNSGELSIGMTYGLEKYWIANSRYLCSSEDGNTWTIEKIQKNSKSDCYRGISKVFYVNGQICAYDSYTQTLYMTSDGKNWTTRVFSAQPHFLKELIYGQVGSETPQYYWLFVQESDTNNYRLYKSSTLTGTLTQMTSYDKDYSKTFAGTIGISDGWLFYTGWDNTDEEWDLNANTNSSGSFWTQEHNTYPFILGKSRYGMTAYTFNYSIYEYDTKNNLESHNYTDYNFTTNPVYYNLHPPYSPEGTIAFPINLNGNNCALYKRASDSAFTKVTGVGTCIQNLDPYVAVYGMDGGGYSTV